MVNDLYVIRVRVQYYKIAINVYLTIERIRSLPPIFINNSDIHIQYMGIITNKKYSRINEISIKPKL